MNLSIKNAVRAAFVVGGMIAATAANAIELPSTGNSSLILYVTNTQQGTGVSTFYYDTGLNLNDLLADGGAGTGTDTTLPAVNVTGFSAFSTPITVAGLSSFIASAASVEDLQWGLVAADSTGTLPTAGARRFAVTSIKDLELDPGLAPTQTTINSANANSTNLFASINTALGAGTSAVVSGVSADLKLGNMPPGSLSNYLDGALTGVSGALNFYVLANAGGTVTSAKARTFVLSDVTLTTAGVLSSISSTTPEVPLPAAVWLFGSGLLGLAGVGRRRQQGVAA
jgi:hypothetical protein